MLQKLIRYRGTRRYYGTYTYSCITEHILVLRILYLYYGAHSCISDLIRVLRILYVYYGTYTCLTDYKTFYLYKSTRRYYRTCSLYRGTRRYYWTYTYFCISDLVLVLWSIYLSCRTYTCVTELILIFRIWKYP